MRTLWIEDNLHDAGAITQVDEDQASVIAPPVNPTGQRYYLTNMDTTQVPAAM